DCRASGLPVKEWCTVQGISTATYYRWERVVLSEVQQQSRPATVSFAELSAPAKMQCSISQCIATVRYKDMNLDIYPGMDTDTFQILLSAIRSC
ncbi:MAG: hypothetical protein KBS74_04025, partial [Clostridiales bacterium]|nr:hypothetical protein [Candidatus Cacconaster stercorequi]